ncbi:hypothetical protein ACPA9J_17395 [Pseudomonas aeruginosa]
MSAAEFRDWQVLLENRTGVVLNEQRRTFLQASLTARCVNWASATTTATTAR